MNAKNKKKWDQVAPIVLGQEVFSMDQTRLMLGGISYSTYYKIRSSGLLKFSRLTPGGMVVHTREQITEYESYLNLDAVVKVA
jgi:hypothetical protein